MTYKEFKKECREMYPTLSNRTMREVYALQNPNTITIADTPPPVVNINNLWWDNNQKEEGINPMNFDYELKSAYGIKTKAAVANAQIIGPVPMEATQRDYAIERIKAIGEKHVQDLQTQFHIDHQTPKTFLELEAAIKNGNYTVDEDAVNSDVAIYGGWNYGVRWGAKADQAGYKAAKEVLKTTAQKALDKATLSAPDKLEAVIDDFEAWEYTPAGK